LICVLAHRLFSRGLQFAGSGCFFNHWYTKEKMKIQHYFLIGCLFISACTQNIPRTDTPLDRPGAGNTAIFPMMTSTSKPGKPSESARTDLPISSPSIGLDFSQARLISVSYGETGVLIIVLEAIGSGIAYGSFYAVISEQKLECSPNAVLPDRIYCVGTKPEGAPGSQKELILYQSENRQEVFRTEIELP